MPLCSLANLDEVPLFHPNGSHMNTLTMIANKSFVNMLNFVFVSRETNRMAGVLSMLFVLLGPCLVNGIPAHALYNRTPRQKDIWRMLLK